MRHWFVMSVIGVTFVLCSSTAQAEWRELTREADAAYYTDTDALLTIHVSRLVWTLADLPGIRKTPTGEPYQSMMVHWRLNCKNDTVAPLAASYFDKPMGKGREVAREDPSEWRPRDVAIRPGTYLAALKRQVCRKL